MGALSPAQRAARSAQRAAAVLWTVRHFCRVSARR